jgi:hypothetical protein
MELPQSEVRIHLIQTQGERRGIGRGLPDVSEKLDHLPIAIQPNPNRKIDAATRQIQVAFFINFHVDHCRLKQASQPLGGDVCLLEYLWAWDVIACKRYDL